MNAVLATANEATTSDDDLFLTDAQLVKFTGRSFKSKQIAWLRKEAVPFKISATGHPVVARAAVEGRQAAAKPVEKPKARWKPRVLDGDKSYGKKAFSLV